MGLVLAGGFLGFWIAVLGFALGAFGLVAALAIWAGSGPVGAAIALGWAALRPVPRQPASAMGSATA